MNSSGSNVTIVRVRRVRRAPRPVNRVSSTEILSYFNRAVSNFDVLGLAQGAVMNTGMLISMFRRQLPSEANHYLPNSGDPTRRDEVLKRRLPLTQRISRFLEHQRVYGAQPRYLPELAVFGLIVIVTVWPMLSLLAAMETLR